MASSNECSAVRPDSPDAGPHRPDDRLKTRADGWAKLCDELSAHALELKELRNELIPDEREDWQRESWLDAEREGLARREADLERRWNALEGRIGEFARRRKHLIAWQTDLEANRRRTCDQQLLKAARLERHAEECFAEASVWAEELEAYDAELSDILRQLDSECEQFDADLGEPVEDSTSP
jgi:hypothetical protein